MTQSCVVFDLDGTLCDLKPTASCYAHSWEEEPIWNILEEMEKEWCMLDVDIIILTGRKHKEHHDATVAWLEKYNVPYDHLIMCMDWAPEENHIFKKRALRVLMQMYKVQMVYDDNPEVEKVCRKLGINFYPCY